jgi:gamma-glutamyltranspeptidase/glutathione hydrolase
MSHRTKGTGAVADSQHKGGVATPHADATRAARDVLEGGGNAVDAALTAAAMLTVVYPNQCSIGGDAIALVGTPDGQAHVVNGSGPSAATLDPADYPTAAGAMPSIGAKSVTVPGALQAWRTLAETWGRRPLADALRCAAARASEGVPVAPGLYRDLIREQANLGADEGTRGTFFADGEVLALGATMKLDQLAGTLRAIAEFGIDEFYRGETGRSIVERLTLLGSDLTLDDFSNFECRTEKALSTSFAGESYLSAGGNSQGVFFLRGLAALKLVAAETGAVPDPLGERAATVAKLLAMVATERDRLLADSDHTGHSDEELLSGPSIRHLALAAMSDMRAPALLARGNPRRTGDTVAIVAADGDGTWVSLIQSCFHAFGSCVLDPVTGVLLHNRGASFSLDPGAPNRLAPGTRPPHTLMPVLVRGDGGFVGAHGAMGGRAQPQIHTHLALNLTLGFEVTRAVARPRWVIGQMEARPLGPDDTYTIAVERGVPEPTNRLLTNNGFRTRAIPELDDEAGHLQVVRAREGGFDIGSDPRADGHV